MPSARRIVVVAFEGAQALDFTGPHEVFAIADRLGGGGRYALRLVSPDGAPLRCSSGLRVVPDGAARDVRGPLDTLVVAGGDGTRAALRDGPFVATLGRLSARARRTCSVCSGAFLLAAAGLLDGRRAATHWSRAGELQRRHPAVRVDPDPLYVRDGDVWTSAGITAGMDLALALVEDDHGREAALDVARWLVLHTARAGGQAQFSVPLAFQAAEHAPVRDAQEAVRADPGAPHTVEALAARAGMPARSFSRAFKRETGMTPAAFVEQVRVERARELLQAGRATTEEVAAACGFGTVETFRRAFRRRLGTSPGAYRDRFRATLRSAA
ncbi:helix-turn-helix domain-containing protein [Conexibacter sp. W3-3-2]|uniref:GlxA family transcriptional regulator n=1 Tax=Conexibacter sp. W3-3-2 TaxID=2675227 RepID=UPI0012B7B8A6|nr:GlxA family transcriptional regulator [Conexibacter sp. W3-3-2]MTD45844.1 helix-turn-helix domain-containing protein [Conexibacter sp. W3-3-2]